jgi:hypothetical protein
MMEKSATKHVGRIENGEMLVENPERLDVVRLPTRASRIIIVEGV